MAPRLAEHRPCEEPQDQVRRQTARSQTACTHSLSLSLGAQAPLPAARRLDKLTLAEAKKYMAEGHFLSRSMVPKSEAIIVFLQANPAGRRGGTGGSEQRHYPWSSPPSDEKPEPGIVLGPRRFDGAPSD